MGRFTACSSAAGRMAARSSSSRAELPLHCGPHGHQTEGCGQLHSRSLAPIGAVDAQLDADIGYEAQKIRTLWGSRWSS